MKKKLLNILLSFMLVFSITTPTYASDITSFLDSIKIDGSGENGKDKVYTLNPGELETKGDELDAKGLFLEYRKIAGFITAILTMTSLFILFYYISKLSHSIDNDFMRKQAIVGIATAGAGVVLMGGATAIIAFFYQFFS